MFEKMLKLVDQKNLHKVYFVLAVTLGTMLSLFMPLFNEPDGQYHLAVSGRIVHTIVDTSRYGEYRVVSGMYTQKESLKNGTHFEKYYLNKANFVEKEDLPRNIRYSVVDFVYWGHLIPAVGLWLGQWVYPSLGVMVTVARFFTMLCCVSALYVIIKRLKAAKLIYFVVFLSPVVLNAFASLSYDATGFVLVAYFLSLVINTIVDRTLDKRRFYEFAAASMLLVIGSKWNYWLLILWIPILMALYIPKYQAVCHRLKQWMTKRKQNQIVTGIALVLFAAVAAIVLTRNHGGLLTVIRRYLMTFGYSYSGMRVHNNDLTSWLSSPYPEFNFMPTWTTAVWYLFFFMALLSEKKFVQNKVVARSSLFFFIVGVLGVFYAMLEYNGAGTSYIEGVQGRYFTPTLVLLQPFFASIKPRLNRSGRRLVPLFVALLVIVSNVLLLFDTTIALIMR